ncbi:MAG: histidine kinase dimerization/phospho-acceptor domain-containing protein, partial [Planctomycetota bacterium]
MRRAWLRFDPVTLLATLLVGVIPSVLLLSVSLLYLTGVSINLTDQLEQPHRERARSCTRALDDEFRLWETQLATTLHGLAVGKVDDSQPQFSDWHLVTAVEAHLPRVERHMNPTTVSEQDRAEALLLALSHSTQDQRTEGLHALESLSTALEDPMGFPYSLEARLYARAALTPAQQRALLLNASVLEPATLNACLESSGGLLQLSGMPQPLLVRATGSSLPPASGEVVTTEERGDVVYVATNLPGGARVTSEVAVEPLLQTLLARVEERLAPPPGVYLEVVAEAASTPTTVVPEGGREWERWPLGAPFHRNYQLSTGTTDHSALDPLASLNRLQDIHLLWGGLAVLAIGVLGSLCLAAVVSRRVQQSHQRDNFLRLVSHELRTPIASVKMLAETLTLGRARDADEQ